MSRSPWRAAAGLTTAFAVAAVVLVGAGGTAPDPAPDAPVGAVPLLSGPAVAGPTPRPPAPWPSPSGAVAQVVRVVDGDTAVVVTGGEQVTLRFIGLDTPETVHPTKPVQCFGPDASTEAKRLLPKGAVVRLHTDPTQGERDRYGRALVHLELPGRLDYAEHMIAGGWGREYTYSRKYARQGAYRATQAAAKAAGRGLWGACLR